MESFEQFVALSLEAEGFVVSEAIKFPVRRKTRKLSHSEVQTHGYEVDLVGARADRLVLATVKSFFGSRGVSAASVAMDDGYRLLNDPVIRDGVIDAAAKRYGYPLNQVTLRLYVGKWAAQKTRDERHATTNWALSQVAGGGPIGVYGLDDVIKLVEAEARSTSYRNNPVLTTWKVLAAAGLLRPPGDGNASDWTIGDNGAEAAELTVQHHRRDRTAKVASSGGARDRTKYSIVASDGAVGEPLRKNQAIRALVVTLHVEGVPAERIRSALIQDWKLLPLDGELSGDDVDAAFVSAYPSKSKQRHRWFLDTPLHQDGRTWVLSNQWGGPEVEAVLTRLAALSSAGLSFRSAPQTSGSFLARRLGGSWGVVEKLLK